MRLKRILFMALMALVVQAASAYDFMAGDIAYNINSDGKSVTVTYTKFESPSNYSSLSGAINIPASVTYSGKTYSVTTIDRSAFYNCTGLTSVTIPNSVTSIDEWAFYKCTGLTSVTIGNSVTFIGFEAFSGCTGLTSITIPNSVTSIDEWAFYKCTGLTSVVWNVKNCTGLSYTYHPFKGCTNIKTFEVGSEVEKIPAYLCYDLTGLTSVTIPNSVTSIGNYAFYRCSGLTSVTIPGSVTSIGEKAFSGCTGLTSVVWNAKNCSDFSYKYRPFYDCANIKSFKFGSEVEKIPAYLCYELTGLPSVTIPNSVTSIGDKAFSGCRGLKNIFSNIEEPANVTMGSSVFYSVPKTTCHLHVPQGTVQKYQAADQWKDFSNIYCKRVTFLSLNINELQLFSGQTHTLNITVLPTDADNRTVNWSSSNTTVATVDQNGKITANKIGTATITATAADGSGMSASCDVTVIGITKISLNKSAASIYVGATEALSATITPSDVINKTLTWKSSNTTVATVDQNGLVTAKAPGTATITATTTDGTNLSASCEVTVRPEYEFTIAPNVAHVRGSENLIHELSVSMDNRNEISGAQFIITLPSNVSMVKDSYGDYDLWLDDARKARNHSVSVESRSGNKYFVLISSPTNKTFKGNTGDILHMNIEIDQYHSGTGDYAISVSGIVLAEPDETQHSAPAASSTVRLCYLVGDANADVEVDVSDYVATANYILGRSTGSRFFTDAANAYYTGNTAINVTDLVAITNIGLELRDKEYKPSVGSDFAMAHAISVPGADYALSAEVVEKSPGKTVVAIDIDNDEPLAALQFDVKLPQGVTLENAAATERTESLQAACGYADGMARVLLSSFGTAEIAVGTGRVLTLTLSGNARHGEPMEISGVTMTERSLTEHSAQSDLLINLTEVSGIGEVAYDHVRIYAQNGSLVIESPVSGMAHIVRINGISQNVPVAAGRNVYPVSAGYGDIIIATFNGTTKKIRF